MVDSSQQVQSAEAQSVEAPSAESPLTEADSRSLDELETQKLEEAFRYDENTGKLYWKISRGNQVKVGAEVTNKGSHGYIEVKYDGRSYLVHRLTWQLFHRRKPSQYIDHINGNKLDNRIENLRECSMSTNIANAKLFSNNKSGARGVSWSKTMSAWKLLLHSITSVKLSDILRL